MDFDDNDEIGQSGHDIQAEEEDLRESLTGLSRLASDRLPLEELLTQVATYAVRAIPGADGAGLTLLEQGRADTIVATAPFVTEVDDIQYAMDQGPCISAAREGQHRPVRLSRRRSTVAAVRRPGRPAGRA